VDVVAAVARVVLAAVFAVAAWGKLTDQAGTRQAVGDFGVPTPAAAAVAFALPVAELAAAVLLLLGDVIGAVAALVLLVLFTVAVGLSLARGRRPDCHCFGQARSQPVSGRTLARNAVLVLLAALVLVA